MRVLEEFFKLIDKGSSARFKELRFNLYEFEKGIAKQKKILSASRYYPNSKTLL
ncbi:hypothetical protein ACFL0T_07540 [Candidatus Omnitrophota bacterium]